MPYVKPRAEIFRFTERDEWPHPQFRTDDPNWQESLLLHWYDRKTGIGGFHRLGHEVNKKKAPIWSLLFSKQDRWRYIRRTDEVLGEADQFANGFGAGAALRNVHEDGLSKWYIDDGALQAELRCDNLFPLVDSVPTSVHDYMKSVATDHFECAGNVTGWVSFEGRRVEVQGLGYRDHSWGARNWDNLVVAERWFTGSFGPALTYQGCVCVLPSGSLIKFGYVVRHGEVTYVEDFDVVVYMEQDGLSHRGGALRFALPGGETIHIRCRAITGAVFAHGNLHVVEEIVESETSDGLKGSGCCEMVNNAFNGKEHPKYAVNVGLKNGIERFEPALEWS
jgi:hypothetical protein